MSTRVSPKRNIDETIDALSDCSLIECGHGDIVNMYSSNSRRLITVEQETSASPVKQSLHVNLLHGQNKELSAVKSWWQA